MVAAADRCAPLKSAFRTVPQDPSLRVPRGRVADHSVGRFGAPTANDVVSKGPAAAGSERHRSGPPRGESGVGTAQVCKSNTCPVGGTAPACRTTQFKVRVEPGLCVKSRTYSQSGQYSASLEKPTDGLHPRDRVIRVSERPVMRVKRFGRASGVRCTVRALLIWHAWEDLPDDPGVPVPVITGRSAR